MLAPSRGLGETDSGRALGSAVPDSGRAGGCPQRIRQTRGHLGVGSWSATRSLPTQPRGNFWRAMGSEASPIPLQGAGVGGRLSPTALQLAGLGAGKGLHAGPGQKADFAGGQILRPDPLSAGPGRCRGFPWTSVLCAPAPRCKRVASVGTESLSLCPPPLQAVTAPRSHAEPFLPRGPSCDRPSVELL